MTTEQKRRLVDPRHRRLSVSRQCALLGLPRSTRYYRSARDDGYNEGLMRLIDKQYTATPFYGVPRMTAWLRAQGHAVNPKRVRRLSRLLGLEAIYPRRRTSMADQAHQKYPYLLSGMKIEVPDQVWSTDITYIRMNRGFIYLMAIMDWFSRYVVCWEVSLTLESSFCVQALERALKTAQPQIFNSDQGSQFTSAEFTKRLTDRGIQLSMDGRGRYYDNIFIERLWRTVKYEEVYLRDYDSVPAAIESLACYFAFYNRERLHQSLDYQTPASVYFGQRGEIARARQHNRVSSPAMAGELLPPGLLAAGTAGG